LCPSLRTEGPDISNDDKRQVRRRCGFGCVVCGLPIYHYDHILGYAQVQRHRPEEITLLCGFHHDLKTRGILPNEEVVAANEHPANLQHGTTAPFTWSRFRNRCAIVLSSDVFGIEDLIEGEGFAVFVVDGMVLLGLRYLDEHLLLTMSIFDEFNQLILQIVDNEMLLSTDQWDVEVEGPSLILRQALREILIDVRFEPPDRIHIRRGRFLLNGVEIVIQPDRYYIPGRESYSTFKGNIFRHSGSGCLFALGVPQPPSAYFRAARINRYISRSEPKTPPTAAGR
jgi:hypothetical protein